MKHAIIILAHKDFVFLQYLVAYFSQDCHVFVHIDRKSSMTREQRDSLSRLPQVAGVYSRYAVHWGGFSILRCEIFMLREALRRCEQTIITKLNGAPACTITIKSNYQFERVENMKRPAMNAYCKLIEQFVSVYPPSYQQPLEMIIDLERLKCESVFDIDMQTGKIAGIVNHNEIVNKWNDYKNSLLNKYSFLRSADTKESVNTFIESVEKAITNEELLMAEFYDKMLFMLLFDGYLVGKPNYSAPYDTDFPSQLFQGVKFPMTLTPRIQKEFPVAVIYDLRSSVPDSVKLLERI